MSGRSASAAQSPEPAVRRGRLLRRGLLALAGVGLLAGFCGGLWRLGLVLPHGAGLAPLHGPLMIAGMGALISLERAVALGAGWAYLGPLSVVLGGILLLGGAPVPGIAACLFASIILAAASVRIARIQPALFTWTMALGAAAWIAGNLVWLAAGDLPMAAGWWLVFLILTIAGERLEMSRLLPPKRGGTALFVLSAVLLLAGAGLGMTEDLGAAAFGAGLLATTLWLLRHDIARRTIRMPGQTRFFAVCMLAGYVWLGIAGLVLLALPPGLHAVSYDAALHAVTIGFVLSMVFGHALIILPAVTGLTVRYTPILYGPLALLHLSVVIRLLAGLTEALDLRAASGPLTILAIIAFAACIAASRPRKAGSVSAEPRTA